jgi:hypothetical protein
MPEIAGATAQREHEVIVWERTLPKDHAPAREIEINHAIEQDGDVGSVCQDAANRLRDLRRGKTGGGHLIKQRLKEMMIGPVHQRDAGGGMIELLAERQPAKSRAQHDDVSCLVLRHAEYLAEGGGSVKEPGLLLSS